MQLWDEFVAEAERVAAAALDGGGKYDMGEAILRVLHDRVAALEAHVTPAVPGPEQQPS